MDQIYWIYILYCNNHSYYTGYTTDIFRRYQEHLSGTASKYTRSFRPLKLAQCWKILESKSAAMQVERFIKKLSKQEKEKLIATPKLLTDHFSFAAEVEPLSLII